MGNRVGMPAPRKELLLLFFKSIRPIYIYIYLRVCIFISGARVLGYPERSASARLTLPGLRKARSPSTGSPSSFLVPLRRSALKCAHQPVQRVVEDTRFVTRTSLSQKRQRTRSVPGGSELLLIPHVLTSVNSHCWLGRDRRRMHCKKRTRLWQLESNETILLPVFNSVTEEDQQ